MTEEIQSSEVVAQNPTSDASVSSIPESPVGTEELKTSEQAVTSPENASAEVKKAEKLFKRSEVAKISNAAKNEGYERAKKELAAQYANQYATPMQSSPQYAQPNQQIGGIPQQPIDPNVIRQLIRQEADKEVYDRMINTSAHEFDRKWNETKDKFEDFDKVTAPLNIGKMPAIAAPIFNSIDNIGEVLYDIAKRSPDRYLSILTAAIEQPELAIVSLQQVSESIKKNNAALAIAKKLPNEPLSQQTPSNTGADSGSMSINDYKKQPWLRG
jgi:hypothetical protein